MIVTSPNYDVITRRRNYSRNVSWRNLQATASCPPPPPFLRLIFLLWYACFLWPDSSVNILNYSRIQAKVCKYGSIVCNNIRWYILQVYQVWQVWIAKYDICELFIMTQHIQIFTINGLLYWISNTHQQVYYYVIIFSFHQHIVFYDTEYDSMAAITGTNISLINFGKHFNTVFCSVCYRCHKMVCQLWLYHHHWGDVVPADRWLQQHSKWYRIYR